MRHNVSKKLKSPILLMCSERSGSNLITKIFDAHPDYCGPGSPHLFKVFREISHLFSTDRRELANSVLDLFEAKVASWKIDALNREDLINLLICCSNSSEMCAALYSAEAAQSGKPHVLVNESNSHAFLAAFLVQAENPKVLFMVRDPRDMAVSWMDGPVMRGGVLRAAERWLSDQTGYMAALASLDGELPSCFLRYEDLLSAPEEQLKRAANDLGIEFDRSMLAFSAKSETAQMDAARSSMWANLNKPLITTNIQKFRSRLSDEQILYVESICAAYMEALGYELVNCKSDLLSGAALKKLRDSLATKEPYDKASYATLPKTERLRFENWSNVVESLKSRSPVSLTSNGGCYEFLG